MSTPWPSETFAAATTSRSRPLPGRSSTSLRASATASSSWLVHEALALNLLTLSRLRATLNDYPRRRGCAHLEELARQSNGALTRSGGEEALFGLIRRARLPQPLTNARVGHWSLDFYWPEHRLAVEIDGVDFHSSRVNIERDHRKDLEMRKLGIDVMRFVGRQVKREPELVLATIARELALREPS